MQIPQVTGSIYNSMKTMKLQMKWAQRKNNPFMKKDAEPEDPHIKLLREQAANTEKNNMISAIDGKLKAGKKLSSQELDYLRQNAPDLYKKAVEVQREREQYKRDLRRCKTKEDVQRLNANRMQRFMSETHTIVQNSTISKSQKCALLDQVFRRLMAIADEHHTFVKSREYAELPEEKELEEEKEARKKKKTDKTSSSDTEIEGSRELMDALRRELEKLRESLNDENVNKASAAYEALEKKAAEELQASENTASANSNKISLDFFTSDTGIIPQAPAAASITGNNSISGSSAGSATYNAKGHLTPSPSPVPPASPSRPILSKKA